MGAGCECGIAGCRESANARAHSHTAGAHSLTVHVDRRVACSCEALGDHRVRLAFIQRLANALRCERVDALIRRRGEVAPEDLPRHPAHRGRTGETVARSHRRDERREDNNEAAHWCARRRRGGTGIACGLATALLRLSPPPAQPPLPAAVAAARVPKALQTYHQDPTTPHALLCLWLWDAGGT